MRGVGDQAALRLERALQPVEQLIDDAREMPDFLSAPRIVDATGEVGGLGAVGQSCHLFDRSQRAMDRKRGDRGRSRDADEHDGEESEVVGSIERNMIRVAPGAASLRWVTRKRVCRPCPLNGSIAVNVPSGLRATSRAAALEG